METIKYGVLYSIKDINFFDNLKQYKNLSDNPEKFVSDDMIQKIKDFEWAPEFEMPRVDVKRFAENLGLKVKDDYILIQAGEIENDMIWINRRLNKKQQNFTVAHEIIHYLLGERQAKRDFSNFEPTYVVKETLIDSLATELLLPEKLVFWYIKEYCRRQGITFEEIRWDYLIAKMSIAFDLPSSIIEERLERLEVIV